MGLHACDAEDEPNDLSEPGIDADKSNGEGGGTRSPSRSNATRNDSHSRPPSRSVSESVLDTHYTRELVHPQALRVLLQLLRSCGAGTDPRHQLRALTQLELLLGRAANLHRALDAGLIEWARTYVFGSVLEREAERAQAEKQRQQMQQSEEAREEESLQRGGSVHSTRCPSSSSGSGRRGSKSSNAAPSSKRASASGRRLSADINEDAEAPEEQSMSSRETNAAVGVERRRSSLIVSTAAASSGCGAGAALAMPAGGSRQARETRVQRQARVQVFILLV